MAVCGRAGYHLSLSTTLLRQRGVTVADGGMRVGGRPEVHSQSLCLCFSCLDC